MKFPTGGEVYRLMKTAGRRVHDPVIHEKMRCGAWNNRLMRSKSVTNSKVWMKEEAMFRMEAILSPNLIGSGNFYVQGRVKYET